ncbi:MAG: recombination protein NinB [Porphyromonadaceae bacterium]|nr:recombination protein NinB [Porphyromonadaceae bacterium]
MEWITKGFKFVSFEEKLYLWVEIPKDMKNTVQEFISSLTDKQYDVVIKPHKEKRSLDANSYMWVICDKIAKAMHDGKTTKEDIYREAIRQVGEWEDKPILNEDVEKHIKMWGMIGDGWFSEQRRESKLRGHKVVRDYYGSHIYDTQSMSVLVDYIVEQAKEMGIETMTPREIEELKRKWGEK